MGLAITVGISGDEARAGLEALRTALAAEGIGWSEPDTPPVPLDPHVPADLPYSALAYLRRVMALVDTGRPVTPARTPEELRADRELIDDETMMFSSHLLCHSDSAGYYVPVDLPDPLFLGDAPGVAGGGMVGSSQGLRAELRRCAPALGITLAADGSLPEAEAHRIGHVDDDADFATEITIWFALWEACRASIAGGHAIVFH
ncbi:hypothetical protein [Catenuloplanes atrovinosus]|uniref:DUF1877 domain-containing protein n=1 Tax=Catenuloplanes atrovinosus TaxID=137266 RepID=A0AAE3YNL2_9ACTN|nr:hypothetical protein [Catenuloplanes atrovinosus]MDR7275046.1 hypothetical protein [Catenuloplanes atrovinosus]